MFYENHSNYGSHRIYIDNLYEWFGEIASHVEIAEGDADFTGFNVIICGKSVGADKIARIRKQMSDKCIIGLADTYSDLLRQCDFGIMGCYSQWNIAVTQNRHCFIFPHIEKIFSKRKKHTNTKHINIMYHGNLEHLEQLSDAYKDGLEEISGKYSVKLLVIRDLGLGEWIHNRPDIDIEEIQWDNDTWEDNLLRGDIGIVPSSIRISEEDKARFFKLHSEKNLRDTDWLFRYKGTVNAGRAFVFHQIGIPVVSEMFPESDSVISNMNCGYIAQTKEAFVLAMEKLIADYSLRQTISDNAFAVFSRIYDPIEWAKKLYSEIESLYIQKFR